MGVRVVPKAKRKRGVSRWGKNFPIPEGHKTVADLPSPAPLSLAQELGIAKSTVYTSIYRAGLNGWLTFEDPRDSLEYQLLPKAIKNLHEALDDETRHSTSGQMVKTQIAEKMAEGALYPRLAGVQAQAAQTLVGIKIQIVGGDPGSMREGTTMGNSTYVDATVEPTE
jgi:hypothetical protein